MASTRRQSRMTTVHSWEEVPAFASEAAEAAFWATHELNDALLADMTSDADESLPPPRARTKPVALRFDETLIRRAKALAFRRGTGYQTLLKEFIVERLYEEEKREGFIGKGQRVASVPRRQRSRQPMKDQRPEVTAWKSVSRRGERHVVPADGGGWDVRVPGSRRAISHHDTQAAATRRAREIVRSAGSGEVVIHGRDAAMRDTKSDRSGRDPVPPRDKLE
ncbi:hypothetical protein BH20ACT24_BH20ACT24_02570 [soil metagenome]